MDEYFLEQDNQEHCTQICIFEEKKLIYSLEKSVFDIFLAGSTVLGLSCNLTIT